MKLQHNGLALEVWASPEPTVARIDAATWRNQLDETGHLQRDSDVSLLASLGIAATRYPVLWETVAPERPDIQDYRWSDRRLTALALAGIEPIVTLLHHGSGPSYTSLIDPCFPAHFANFARAVARRYPHVRRWTPINEPLTTARFSTLYATWYPNRFFDHAAFGRALVYESLAIVLAMRAIRESIPHAELVLTEDLQDFVAADDRIAPYVEHKRERRYLSAELVMGRVSSGHPLWHYLVDQCHVPIRDLESLRGLAMPVDLMGWNYYPNSERVLMTEGAGHSNIALVDLEPERLAPLRLLQDAYKRLAVPMALSEVHIIGNENERARWMLQRWTDVLRAREAGVDMRAFGAWAAFGMIDWVSLLCRRENIREDGVFTCVDAAHHPQPTLVADVVRSLANGRPHALPQIIGWWERTRTAGVA